MSASTRYGWLLGLIVASATSAVVHTELSRPLQQRRGSDVLVRDEPRPLASGTSQLVGVVSSGLGSPIAGATVRIGVNDREYRATTDGAGRYSFVNLPAGPVTAGVIKQGYLLSRSTHGTGELTFPRTVKSIMLVEGEVLRIDFTLAPAGAVSGNILDEYGEAVHGAQVSLIRRSFTNGSVRLVRANSVRTDDTGRYQFEGLEYGEYLVEVAPPNLGGFRNRHAPQSVYPATLFPSATDIADARRLTITGDEPAFSADITLRPVDAMEIGGFVVDSRGVALTGVTVTVRDLSPTQRSPELRAPTGSRGAFSVRGIPLGAYVLWVDARCCGGDDRELGFVTVGPADDSRQDVRIVTAPRAQMSGRIVGLPASEFARLGLSVRAVSTIQGLVPDVGERVGEDGRFELVLPPAAVRLELSGLPQGWFVQAVRRGGADIDNGVVDPARGDTRDIEFVVSDATGHLEGSVVTSGPRRSQEIVVAVFALAEDSAVLGGRIRHLSTTHVDAQGRFAVRDLPPGQYHVAAVDDLLSSRSQDPEFLARLSRQANPVTIHEGAVASLRLNISRVSER